MSVNYVVRYFDEYLSPFCMFVCIVGIVCLYACMQLMIFITEFFDESANISVHPHPVDRIRLQTSCTLQIIDCKCMLPDKMNK